MSDFAAGAEQHDDITMYLRFVFLTGISKFSQLSAFSELNNLQQLTFGPAYDAYRIVQVK